MTRKPLLIVVMCILALNLCEAPVIAADAKGGQPASAGKAGETGTKLLYLNTATKAQLMTLPGITAAYADKIIEKRPFYVKTQLRQKEVIPAEVFYGIVDKIDLSIIPKKEPTSDATKVKKRNKK